jgi:PilZ domain
MEHRWGHRRELSRAVHIGARNGVGRYDLAARGRITNVSISGAYVVSPLPVSLFSYVQLQFNAMRHGKRTTAALEGQIVRKDASGFGIEWSEFAPEAVRVLMMVPPFRRAEPPDPHVQWEPTPARARVHT